MIYISVVLGLLVATWVEVAQSIPWDSQTPYGLRYIHSVSCSGISHNALLFAINTASALVSTGSTYFIGGLLAPEPRVFQSESCVPLGAPSWKNLSKTPWHKTLLVVVLMLTLIPLQLMYVSLRSTRITFPLLF